MNTIIKNFFTPFEKARHRRTSERTPQTLLEMALER